MKQVKKSGIATALGAVVIGSLASVSLQLNATTPFSINTLDSGYMEIAEGKCGEGKCGGDKSEKKDAEGKCGEGKCGGDKADKEGKCGEGKCGGK